MKRAILFTAITAIILGISGLRPAEAAGALNHGPRLTVKVATPGSVEKAHYRRFSRGRVTGSVAAGVTGSAAAGATGSAAAGVTGSAAAGATTATTTAYSRAPS